ncbi:hypothetical protein HN358_01675 [Candidatus Uhrbacteria bacterium]|jgi:hypothetical protein|nr:hypothetical protein [Candidatus Uhrbacteria bacterium]MBT7717747.1 hypothetical protein [Candidatus Uhrbacteria bacterium]
MASRIIEPFLLTFDDNSSTRVRVGTRIIFDKNQNSMFMEFGMRRGRSRRVYIDGESELFFDEPLTDSMIDFVVMMIMAANNDLQAIEVDHPDPHIRDIGFGIN